MFDRRRGPIVFVVMTVLFALVTTALLLIPALMLSGRMNATASQTTRAGVIGLLVFAPIVENLVAVAVIELMATYRARTWVIVGTVAILSGAVHAAYGWRAIAGFVGFATWSFSYLTWYDLRFPRRFALTVAQHALFNLPGTLSIVWSTGTA